MRLVHTSAISLQTRLQHQSRAIPAPSPQASRACHTPTFTATKKGDPEPGLVGVPSSHSSRRNTSSSSRTLSKKPIASSSSSMAARAAEGKQEAGSTQRQQQQQQQQRPPRAPAGRQAGDRRAGKSAGQAYTSMLASAESVLAPGHRLAMKGSIMNLFLLPLSSSPVRRARLPRVPTLRKGKRGLRAAARGMNAGQRRQPAPSAVRSFLDHSARPRLGCRARPDVPVLRCRPHRARPFWTRRPDCSKCTGNARLDLRGGAARSFCGHRAGERLAEASGAKEEGGRRPQTGRAGAGGGLLPRDKLYLQLLAGALGQGGGGGERLPREATLHLLSPRPRPRGIVTRQSPLRTSASGSIQHLCSREAHCQ